MLLMADSVARPAGCFSPAAATCTGASPGLALADCWPGALPLRSWHPPCPCSSSLNMPQPAHPLELYNQTESILLRVHRIKQECAVTVWSLNHCLIVDMHSMHSCMILTMNSTTTEVITVLDA